MWFAPIIEAVATAIVSAAIAYLKKRTGNDDNPCPEAQKKQALAKKRKRTR